MFTHRRLSLFIFTLLLCFLPSTGFGWVKFYESEHRLDASPGDTQAKVVYRFANKGKKPVKILSVESSCGCTTAKLPKAMYNPGERGKIEVTFDFGDRQGWHQKTITVKTDDKHTPVKVLKLSVNIPQIAKFGPKVLQWQSPTPGSSNQRNPKNGPRILHFSGKPDLNIKITELDYDEKSLMVTELKTDQEHVHQWAVMPRDLNKAIESAIRIYTDFPKDKPKEYTIQVKVLAASAPGSVPDNSDDSGTKGSVKTKESKATLPTGKANAKADQIKKAQASPRGQWMRKVFTQSDDLPIRLERPSVLLHGRQKTKYITGQILTNDPIEIQNVEIKGMDNVTAELVPLNMAGYFMIKLNIEKPEEEKEVQAQAVDAKKTPAAQPKKQRRKRGEILIHTNPPADTPNPVYGFIHVMQMPTKVSQKPNSKINLPKLKKAQPIPQTQPAKN